MLRSDAIFCLKKISLALCGSQGTGRDEPSGPETAMRLDVGGERLGLAGRPVSKVFLSGEVTLPRKEVIQPHVPVRLPCYDFTPLTLHTFGASPHCWLGRRLRVQTTRVV